MLKLYSINSNNGFIDMIKNYIIKNIHQKLKK